MVARPTDRGTKPRFTSPTRIATRISCSQRPGRVTTTHRASMTSTAGHNVINLCQLHRRLKYDAAMVRIGTILVRYSQWMNEWMNKWMMIFTCVSHADVRLRYRLSVCLSVCPSHAGIVSKRLNILSCFLHHTIARSFYSLCVDYTRSSRNSTGSCTPCGGAKQRWGMKMSQFSTNNLLYLGNGWR